jgi:hypothetical protein
MLGIAVAGNTPSHGADDNNLRPPVDNAKTPIEAVSEAARTFVSDTCVRCHNSVKKTARLDLTTLAYDPEDRGNFALWVKVHDRAASGEMPPEEARQPDPAKRKAFVADLADTFIASEKRQMGGEGRATQRRMNRFEYENALRDLLGIPMAQIAGQLPQDGEAYRFNKSAEALDVSFLTMQRFMSAADFAMRQAISQQLNRPQKTVTKLYAREESSLTRSFRTSAAASLRFPARRPASAKRSARRPAYSVTPADTVGAFAPRPLPAITSSWPATRSG